MERWQKLLAPRIPGFDTKDNHQVAVPKPCVQPEVSTVIESPGATFNHVTTTSKAHSSLVEDRAQSQASGIATPQMMAHPDTGKARDACLDQDSQKTVETNLNAPSSGALLLDSAIPKSTPSTGTTAPATPIKSSIDNLVSQIMASWDQPRSMSSSSAVANGGAGNDSIQHLNSLSNISENVDRPSSMDSRLNTPNSNLVSKDAFASMPTTVQCLSSVEAATTHQMSNNVISSMPATVQSLSSTTKIVDESASMNLVTPMTSQMSYEVTDSNPTRQADMNSASRQDSTIVPSAYKPTFNRKGFRWQTRDKDLLWYLRHTKGWTKEQVYALNRFPTSMPAMQLKFQNLVKERYDPQQMYFAPVEYAALDPAEYMANRAQAKKMKGSSLPGEAFLQTTSRDGRKGVRGGRGKKVPRVKINVHWCTKRAQEKRAERESNIQVIEDFWTPKMQDLLIYLIEELDWPYEKIYRTNRFCVPKDELVAKYRRLVINEYVPTQEHFSEEEYAPIEGTGSVSNFKEVDSNRPMSLVTGMQLRARPNVDSVQEMTTNRCASRVDGMQMRSGSPMESIDDRTTRRTGSHLWQIKEKDLLLFLRNRKGMRFDKIQELNVFPATHDAIKTHYYNLVRTKYKPRQTHFEEEEYLDATSRANAGPLSSVAATHLEARPIVHPVEEITKTAGLHYWQIKEKDVLMFLKDKEGMRFEEIHDLDMFSMSLSALATQYYYLVRTKYKPSQIHFEEAEYLSANERSNPGGSNPGEHFTAVVKRGRGRPRKSIPPEASASHVKEPPVTPPKRRLDPVVKEAAMVAAGISTMSHETRSKRPRLQIGSSAEASVDFDQLMQQHIGKSWDNAITTLHKSMEGLVQIDPDSDHELNSQFLLIKIKKRAFGALERYLQS